MNNTKPVNGYTLACRKPISVHDHVGDDKIRNCDLLGQDRHDHRDTGDGMNGIDRVGMRVVCIQDHAVWANFCCDAITRWLIQHILTEEIFSKVFDEDDFHHQKTT